MEAPEQKTEEWIVELNVIGFVNPVEILVPVVEGESEDDAIRTAFEHLALTDGGDASFVSIRRR